METPIKKHFILFFILFYTLSWKRNSSNFFVTALLITLLSIQRLPKRNRFQQYGCHCAMLIMPSFKILFWWNIKCNLFTYIKDNDIKNVSYRWVQICVRLQPLTIYFSIWLQFLLISCINATSALKQVKKNTSWQTINNH